MSLLLLLLLLAAQLSEGLQEASPGEAVRFSACLRMDDSQSEPEHTSGLVAGDTAGVSHLDLIPKMTTQAHECVLRCCCSGDSARDTVGDERAPLLHVSAEPAQPAAVQAAYVQPEDLVGHWRRYRWARHAVKHSEAETHCEDENGVVETGERANCSGDMASARNRHRLSPHPAILAQVSVAV
jgi:hypothetical protein